MKKVILGMMAISIMSLGDQWTIKKGDDKCIVISKTAYTIMQARQGNVPMMNVLKHFSDKTALGTLSKDITMQAYAQPRFGSKSYQNNAQVDFANMWLSVCMKPGKGTK